MCVIIDNYFVVIYCCIIVVYCFSYRWCFVVGVGVFWNFDVIYFLHFEHLFNFPLLFFVALFNFSIIFSPNQQVRIVTNEQLLCEFLWLLCENLWKLCKFLWKLCRFLWLLCKILCFFSEKWCENLFISCLFWQQSY